MNQLLVARHDGVDRRILPRPQTFETKLACVIGERCGNVHSRAPVSTGDGEEHRRNLTEHGPSLPQMGRAVASGEKTKSGETVTSDEKKGKQIPHRRSPKTGDRVRDDRLKKGPTRSRSLSLFGYECALSCILGLSSRTQSRCLRMRVRDLILCFALEKSALGRWT